MQKPDGSGPALQYNVVGFHGSGSVSYKTALAAIFVEGEDTGIHALRYMPTCTVQPALLRGM
jgi:hypothetical protein